MPGIWNALKNQPNFGVGTMLLLTDGTVMAQNSGTSHWWRLTPDATGSYQNGTWSQLADGPNAPLYFASAVLRDGRVFVAGGADPSNNTQGIAQANIFDPATRLWSAAASMAQTRWYPTVTCLPDGRVLVVSGSQLTGTDYVTVPEIYNATTNTWSRLTSLSASIPYYPHNFVLPDGRVLEASTFGQPIASDVLTISPQKRTVVDSRLLDGGSAVMYLPGKIMKSGTATANNGSTSPSAATTYVLDMTAATPAWQQTASMQYARAYHTLTILPDGKVLVTGGGGTRDSTDVADAVDPAEIWSPQSQTWTTVASMQTPRLYHSTALLLPDGRVLVAGGGRNFRSSLKELNAEIYSPPYLFNGPRPAITTIGGTATAKTKAAGSAASPKSAPRRAPSARSGSLLLLRESR